MVLSALASLKSLIKTKSYHIDLPFFRLHYQATVSLLLAFCLILTAKVLFGETIKCHSRLYGDRDPKYVDNLCYASGTYSYYELETHNQTDQLPNVTFKASPISQYMFTGIPLVYHEGAKRQVFWHNYYQYVPLILFIQAILFYFPHYLWKLWENGIISSICQRLQEHRFAPHEYFDSNYDIISYIQNTLRYNKSLVYKYYFCHVLCLFNLIVQIIALNMIFNYQFVAYGYLVIQYVFFDSDIYGLRSALPIETAETQRTDLNSPMDVVFPKVTSCQFAQASQAGVAPDSFKAMCVLPLNILHDKFFLLLWFWFAILVVLTVIQIINDVMFTMLPIFRRHLFAKKFGSKLWGGVPDDSCLPRSASLQEIFLLNLVGHNTDKFSFSVLLRRLNKDEDWTASPSENQSIV